MSVATGRMADCAAVSASLKAASARRPSMRSYRARSCSTLPMSTCGLRAAFSMAVSRAAESERGACSTVGARRRGGMISGADSIVMALALHDDGAKAPEEVLVKNVVQTRQHQLGRHDLQF